jgi:hypothetical protein
MLPGIQSFNGQAIHMNTPRQPISSSFHLVLTKSTVIKLYITFNTVKGNETE